MNTITEALRMAGLHLHEAERLSKALGPVVAERERGAAERAWDEGYDAGYDDCNWDERSISTDPGQDEHPHENPYRAERGEA